MSASISEDVQERELKIRNHIERHASMFGLDPNLVRALITQESRFIAEAVSPTGAYGFGQFTGIGARQVKNIADMKDCPDSEGLHTFTKGEASNPDLGIKAVCATLWWLYNKKYSSVSDKKVQLEAVLTFYNSGGKAAYLVVLHKGHDKAIQSIKELPGKYQSQAARYAPEVAQWYIAWHDLLEMKVKVNDKYITIDPFQKSKDSGMDIRFQALLETLRVLGDQDDEVDVMISSREGFTEVTLIIPGEYV